MRQRIGWLLARGAQHDSPAGALDADGDGRHWTPISRALDVVGDRWTLLILGELLDGSLRFKQLHERIPAISKISLNRHLREMLANGLVSRQSRELRPRIEYELTESGRDLLCVVEDLSRWAMRRHWSAPGRDEHVEPRLLMRHLPWLLESARLPSGMVELLIEHPENPDRQIVNLNRGSVSLLRADLDSVMPWARIAGDDRAWIEAFGPARSPAGLQISGDLDLAGALLGALPSHG